MADATPATDWWRTKGKIRSLSGDARVLFYSELARATGSKHSFQRIMPSQSREPPEVRVIGMELSLGFNGHGGKMGIRYQEAAHKTLLGERI